MSPAAVTVKGMKLALRKSRSQNERPCLFGKTAVRQTRSLAGLCASTVNLRTFMHGGAAKPALSAFCTGNLLQDR